MDIKNIFREINHSEFVIKVKNLINNKCNKIVTWMKEDIKKVKYEKVLKELKK